MPRHRWFKIKTHHRVCVRCGAHKRSIELGLHEWATEYSLPDGTVAMLNKTPACAPGEFTDVQMQEGFTEAMALGVDVSVAMEW